MKKLLAVAVVALLSVSSAQAAWGSFAVIGEGEGEGQIGTNSGIKIRYSPMENLEIFSTYGGNAGLGAQYIIGGRYQIIPMLSASLDIGIPTSDINPPFGVAPGIQFHMDFTDMISFGSAVGAGLNFADPDMVMNLRVNLEVDFAINDNISIFVGTDVNLDNMTAENWEFDAKSDIEPYFGATFSVGNLSLDTNLGLRLNALNKDGDDTVGFSGGVAVGIKF